jgi:pantoate--beta-alanine ligase
MLILTTPAEVHEWVRALPSTFARGFVPTMGALHRGHESLLQMSLAHNDTTALSIFVNPTQFNVRSDYDNYPITHARDLALAEHHGVDMVYMPSVDTMYPEGFGSYIEPGTTAEHMEGKNRPGHFRGVTTIVAKLFNAVQPHRAYFGKKDFQQLAVIQQMVRELDFPIEVVGVDTVREDDGLAMSSRNQRLNPQQRAEAHIIYEALQRCKEMSRHGVSATDDLYKEFSSAFSSNTQATIEYVTVCDSITLREVDEVTPSTVMCVAVWFGDVRLIDNIELSR